MEYSDVEKIHIKNNNGLQDNELEVFLAAAGRYGLNPLANQIYARVSGGRSGRRLGFMTGIDGYRAIADRTGSYAGNDDPVFDSEDKPQKATVTVYKIVGGARCPFTATARWDQYYPGDQSGRMWKRMPHLMLGKCAEALALRKAFPAQLAGLYTQEEMDQAGPGLNSADSITVDSSENQEARDYAKAICKPLPENPSGEVLGPVGKEQIMALLDSAGLDIFELRAAMSKTIPNVPQDEADWPNDWMARVVKWAAAKQAENEASEPEIVTSE